METHVLIVEDDPAIVQLLRTLLPRLGFQITIARDGVEAVEQFHSAGADVVLLDLNLPRKPGWEVYQEIKASSDVPFLVMTGNPLMAESIEGILLPKDSCVYKPFDVLDLAERLRYAVEAPIFS